MCLSVNARALVLDGNVVAFDSEREDGEELDDVFIRIACKALVAFDEYLPKLLERKEIEVDEVTSGIAVIAGKQRDVALAPANFKPHAAVEASSSFLALSVR